MKVESTGMLPVHFSYSLVPTLKQTAARSAESYETRVVHGAWWSRWLKRPDIYEFDAHGLLLRHTNPEKEKGPIVSTFWNAEHLEPERKEDSAGALSTYRYDAFGNTIDERLRKSASAPVTVEKWSCDPAFSNAVCHVGPEGRLTLTWTDSNGSDPRIRAPVGSGLVLQTVEYARRVDLNALASDATCLELARTVSSSPEDRVTLFVYCGIDGAVCKPGWERGTLAEKRSGSRRELEGTRVDSNTRSRASR